eukprot:scaffold92_cov86-Skeletonema_marinoi.AAC.1
MSSLNDHALGALGQIENTAQNQSVCEKSDKVSALVDKKQSSNGRELSMFEFDETDDDILSTFDHFDGSDLNGDDLLEALSNHDDNLFDDID